MSTRNSAGCRARSIAARSSGMRLVTPVEVSLWTTQTALIGGRGPRRAAPRPRRVDAVAPVAGHELDLQAELVGHRPPQRGELPRLEHQDAVARRKRVDQRRFPGARARGGVDDDRPLGPEDALHPVEDLAAEDGELRTAMVDRRPTIARRTRSGTLVGPGICRKCGPLRAAGALDCGVASIKRLRQCGGAQQYRQARIVWLYPRRLRRRMARSRPSRVKGNMRSSVIRRTMPMLAVPVQYFSGTGFSHTACG